MSCWKKCTTLLVLSMMAFFVVAQENSSLTNVQNSNLDDLKKIIQDGRDSLQSIINNPSADEVSNNMQQLGETILAATERARRLCDWNMEDIERDTEQTFDKTIAAIEEYLDLVKDNGLVHKTAIRIRASAFDQARIFREKATAKSSQRYLELAAAMESQGVKVTEIWEAIAKERSAVYEELAKLKDSRELYIDTKKALGIKEAVEELSKIRDDLTTLRSSMEKVQTAVMTIEI